MQKGSYAASEIVPTLALADEVQGVSKTQVLTFGLLMSIMVILFLIDRASMRR